MIKRGPNDLGMRPSPGVKPSISSWYPSYARPAVASTASSPQREIEIHDGVAPVALGVDGVEARGEKLALGVERLEEADRAILVA